MGRWHPEHKRGHNQAQRHAQKSRNQNGDSRSGFPCGTLMLILALAVTVLCLAACGPDSNRSDCDRDGAERSVNGYLQECHHTAPDPHSPMKWGNVSFNVNDRGPF